MAVVQWISLQCGYQHSRYQNLLIIQPLVYKTFELRDTEAMGSHDINVMTAKLKGFFTTSHSVIEHGWD